MVHLQAAGGVAEPRPGDVEGGAVVLQPEERAPLPLSPCVCPTLGQTASGWLMHVAKEMGREPTIEETIHILEGIKDRYEAHHKL